MKRLFLLSLGLFLITAALPAFGREIVLAVLAKRGPRATVKRWQPLADYLSRKTPYHVILRPLSFEQLKRAVRLREVDLVLANPAMYVEFETCCGLSPIVTMKNLKFGRVYSLFGGVIFARADRRDLRNLHDLKGALIGAVDPDSFGGWLMQWRVLKEAGLRRRKDFRVRFYGTHDAVVYAVLKGEVDAGCVRTDTLETMAREGKIRLRDFKVLHRVYPPGFDLLVSTELYPEWPLARSPRLRDEIAEVIASVLLALPKDSPVARRTGAAWTIPANYQPVHACLRYLGVGPYAELAARALRKARQRYLLIITGLLIFSLSGVLVICYILSLHHRLRKAYLDLSRHRDHLEEEVRKRTRSLEEALRKLREERERLEVVLSALADAVVATDVEGRITLLNASAERILGRKAQEVLGKPFCKVFSLEPTSCKDLEELSSSEKASYLEEVPIRLPGGEEAYFEVVAHPVCDEEGKMVGRVVVFRDITLRKRLEEEARRTTQLETLSIVSSGLAHDFNNLLATISGYLEVLKLKFPSPEIQTLVEKAEKACLTARTLTRELLTYTKGGAPVKKAASLEKIVREALEFALAGSGIRIHQEFQARFPPLQLDAEQLTICLHNIFLNARQAMHDRGEIFVTLRQEGNEAVIEIRDTGPGIPEELQAKIFEPFFSTREGGSGLGLYTCRRIIEAHGGRIEVESRPGEGALFRLRLPLVPARAEERRRESPPQAADGEPLRRILILDDEEGVRESMAEILRLHGFEVETAAEGREALERFRKALSEGRRFDLVILDLTVPGGWGGREVLPELRKLDPGVRALVASGYSQDPVVSKPREFGFDGALLKPFTAQSLVSEIHRILERENPSE